MITSEKIKQVQKKIAEALKEIEASEKVTITFGNSRYCKAYYTTPMKVTTTEKSEAVKGVYEEICRDLGFTQDIIGMEFTKGGQKYKISEIKTRNRKYPVIAEREDGASYKYSVTYIKSLIGGDKIINRNANLEKLVPGLTHKGKK